MAIGILSVLALVFFVWANPVWVAVDFPQHPDSNQILAASLMALRDFYLNNPHSEVGTIYPGRNRGTDGIGEGDFTAFVASLRIPAVIGLGSASGSAAAQVGYLSSVLKIPIVSFLSSNEDFVDNSLYSFVMRTCASDSNHILATLMLLQTLRWKTVAVFTDSVGDNKFADMITETAKTWDVVVKGIFTYDPCNPWDDETTFSSCLATVNAALDAAKSSGAMVFVLHGKRPVSGQIVLERAVQKGMLGIRDTTYGSGAQSWACTGNWFGQTFFQHPNCSASCVAELKKQTKGLVGHRTARSKQLLDWQAKSWNPRTSAENLTTKDTRWLWDIRERWDLPNGTSFANDDMDPAVPAVFDAVKMVFTAAYKLCNRNLSECDHNLHSLIDNKKVIYQPPTTQHALWEKYFGSTNRGYALMDALNNVTINGTWGTLEWEESGNVKNVQFDYVSLHDNCSFVPFAQWSALGGIRNLSLAGAVFVDGKNEPPLDCVLFEPTVLMHWIIIAGCALCGVGMLVATINLCFSRTIALHRYRSPFYFQLLGMGCCLAELVLTLVTTTETLCRFRDSLLFLGLSMILAGQIARHLRVFRVLENESCKRMNINNSFLFGTSVVFAAPMTILMHAWMLLKDPVYRMEMDQVSLGVCFKSCGGTADWLFPLQLTLCVLATLFCAFLAFLVRGAPKAYRETTGSTIFCTIVLVLMLFSTWRQVLGESKPSALVDFWLRVAVYFCVTFSAFCCIFVPFLVVGIQHYNTRTAQPAYALGRRMSQSSPKTPSSGRSRASSDGSMDQAELAEEIHALQVRHANSIRKRNQAVKDKDASIRALTELRMKVQELYDRMENADRVPEKVVEVSNVLYRVEESNEE